MKRPVFLALVLGGLLLASPASPSPGQAQERPIKPRAKAIDIAICLDVSNSMDGLIGSAKAKLWDIVNDLARIRPTPHLRVALFSYGNDNYNAEVGWIRKDLDFTTDLDDLYGKLFALTTRGGTEYVTRVCRDAVEQLKWSDDPRALKIIFVCGNEPASQDKVVSLQEAARKAKASGIIINPIYCGGARDADARDWIEFARLCGGRFSNIDQDRGVVALKTPMDKKLVELGGKLNETYVVYGKGGEAKAGNQAAQDGNALKAGSGVAAARNISKVGGLYRCEDWDLVDRCKTDPKFDVRTVPLAELSESLRKMTPDQRVAHVKEMAARRAVVQKEIDELGKQRTAYINEHMRKNPNPALRAFDAAIQETLREQAAAKGINLPK
jgi:hypothetical protein